MQAVKLFTQHFKISKLPFFCVCVSRFQELKSFVPGEGREAAICHGLCPVLCSVSVVAAKLWIMTLVGS